MTTATPTAAEPNYPGVSLQTVLIRFTRGGQRYTSIDAVWSRFTDDDFTVALCQPRPELLEFAVGGTMFVDDDGNPIGWDEPSTPNAEPIDVEVYTARVREGTVVGYYHWSATCEGLRFDGATFDSENSADFLLSGTATPGTRGYRLDPSIPASANGIEDIA